VGVVALMGGPKPEQPRMADYGVGGEDWEGLPWSWASERLVPNRNYWVGTVSGSGRPHSLPVWGVWDDGDQRFMFSCGPSSRKARDLAANPQVVVTVDDTVECVSVEGVARILEPTDPAIEVWVERYLAKYRPVSPDLSADFIRANLVVEVVPDRAFGIIEREDEFSSKATRWTF
jgi:nitroimidazol reductase NimA-like FMN-containing flavoprotein (pyridoxamine 5'-phosphate oxidase superfamily)